jgi:lipid-A-disaccharide synthase
MANADLAWAKSGTTTLEVAMFGTPMFIYYLANWISFCIFLVFKRVQRVGWPNLLAGETIIPELIQLDCREDLLVRYTNDLLDVPALRQEIRDRLMGLRSQLGQGEYTANCAAEILEAVNY